MKHIGSIVSCTSWFYYSLFSTTDYKRQIAKEKCDAFLSLSSRKVGNPRFIYIPLRAANIITQAFFPQEMWVNVTCDDEALLDVCHHIEPCKNPCRVTQYKSRFSSSF